MVAFSDIILTFAIIKEVSFWLDHKVVSMYSPWTLALPSVCRGETLWSLAAALGSGCDPCCMDWMQHYKYQLPTVISHTCTLIYTTPWRNLTCCRHHVTIPLSAECSQLILTDTYIQGPPVCSCYTVGRRGEITVNRILCPAPSISPLSEMTAQLLLVHIRCICNRCMQQSQNTVHWER